MVRKIARSLLWMILMVASSCNWAYGNAGPIIVEEDPVFTMMPAGSTEIGVEEELLVFDFSKGDPYSVDVQAVYKMVNGTDTTITQTMMFPLITMPASGFLTTVSISVDGKLVDFKGLRFQDYAGSQYGVSTIHNYDDYITRANALDINDLLSAWNEGSDEVSYFNIDDEIQVITFSAPLQNERYEIKIGYQINPARSKLMATGFTYHSWNNRGTGSFGKWIENTGNEGSRQTPVFYVLGEPIDEEQLNLTPSVNIHSETIKARKLIDHWVEKRIHNEPAKNEEAYYDYLVKKIDDFLSSDTGVAHLDDDILEPYFYQSYVGALVYDVTFAPGSVREVVVEYTAEASHDRTDTSRYGALVAYLLNPARGWKDFKDLTIHIYPHQDQPYLLESSLAMKENQQDGSYSAYYETLPDENLVFRMYHRDKPETGLLKTFSNPYILLLIIPVGLVLAVLGVVTMVVMLALKKNSMNLKE